MTQQRRAVFFSDSALHFLVFFPSADYEPHAAYHRACCHSLVQTTKGATGSKAKRSSRSAFGLVRIPPPHVGGTAVVRWDSNGWSLSGEVGTLVRGNAVSSHPPCSSYRISYAFTSRPGAYWMLRSTRSLCGGELRSGINTGRRALAGQFAAMDGWQAGQSDRFDQYVKEQRLAKRFDGFDQRVERAFRVVAKAHKIEVVNAFKRNLKRSGSKFGAQQVMDMRRAVEARTAWLRDVWAQVDADYRSEDPTRQQVAAGEISAALAGEPGEYMSWAYEEQRRRRFAGPKEAQEMDTEMAGANLPDVSPDEGNRYHSLQMRMSTVEDNVKRRYGMAGAQHWSLLQEEKDRLYDEKLDRSARIFQQLLDQSERYDESRRTALLRSHVARVHQAQVRFKASMELEREREEMMAAHATMEAERQRVAREDRVALLREAADLKAKGVPTAEIALAMKERQLERHAQRQAAYQLAEQERVHEAQATYRGILRDFKHQVEEREGLELMGQQAGRPGATRAAAVEDPPWSGGAVSVHQAGGDTPSTASDGPAAAPSSKGTTGAGPLVESSPSSKEALWDAVRSDQYEDPFRVVHQARLDAAKHYDAIYAKYFPTSLALGKKYSRQNMGEEAAGNEMDRQVFQKASFVMEPYQWGMRGVHDLDSDGSVDYLTHMQFHVRDKHTGDIDWRYEKKKGGPMFRGPALYKIGAQREAADPGEQAMDPSYLPYRQRRRNYSSTRTGQSICVSNSNSFFFFVAPLACVSTTFLLIETNRTVIRPHTVSDISILRFFFTFYLYARLAGWSLMCTTPTTPAGGRQSAVTNERTSCVTSRPPPIQTAAAPNLPDRRTSTVGSSNSGPSTSTVIHRNLWFFIWLKAIGSYDSGAFSAVLGAGNGIAEAWALSTVEQGSLTSSVFLGNVLGCPLAGHCFSHYDEKRVFAYSLFFHMVFTILFGAFQEYYVALVNRFFIGLTLAFIVVYTPVWVDEFAPKERQSMWQAFQNAGVPLGIMFGYILGAFFPTYTSLGWDWSFYIKGVLMVPTVLYLTRVDRRTINTRRHGGTAALEVLPATRTSPGAREVVADRGSWRHRMVPSFRSKVRGFTASMRHLMTNIVYMCSTLSMCALYFAATGLQNFVTPYLRGEPFNAPMQTIMLGFGVAVVTAPVCGVIVGGIVLDRIGGYSSDVLRTTLFALVCGAIGGVCAIICIFVTTTGTFLLVMSVLLFCGGGIIPPGIGLTMSSIPSSQRSAGAAFSQTVYNLLGNFSGPLVCGFVADWTGELRNGIIVILLSSVLGILPLLVLVGVAWFRPHRIARHVPYSDDIDRRDVIVEADADEQHQVQVPDHPPPSSRSLSRERRRLSAGTEAQTDTVYEVVRTANAAQEPGAPSELPEQPAKLPVSTPSRPVALPEEVLLERLMSRRLSNNEEMEQAEQSRSRSRRRRSLIRQSSSGTYGAPPSNRQWNESVSLPNQHNFGMEVVRSLLMPSFDEEIAENSAAVDSSSDESDGGGETAGESAPISVLAAPLTHCSEQTRHAGYVVHRSSYWGFLHVFVALLLMASIAVAANSFSFASRPPLNVKSARAASERICPARYVSEADHSATYREEEKNEYNHRINGYGRRNPVCLGVEEDSLGFL
eukprot:gene10189-7137_t